jgi:hypothetical protein
MEEVVGSNPTRSTISFDKLEDLPPHRVWPENGGNWRSFRRLLTLPATTPTCRLRSFANFFQVAVAVAGGECRNRRRCRWWANRDCRAADTAQREPEPVSTHSLASADFAHSPATCLVVTLRRFQTLIAAIAMISAASAGSS